MAASSSSSSSTAAEPRLTKHDVFLSFSGTDTRKKFTSHLYSALSEKQITYKDDVNLKKGDTISPALLEAIEESEISIIIFSENYASSSWCLDELVHILKCKNEKGRIVLPIFIDIDPSHIRYQKESYAASFEKHEKRFKAEKVREWRQALTEAAGLSGWDSRNMSESVVVKEVAELVRTELDNIKSKRSDKLKGLVGIPERLKKIKSFLNSPTVRIIGIWGMGGIGKTTLAKAVFHQFYNDFEGSCFAPNVRENAINKGLDTLKKEVFSELLGEKILDIFKSDVNDRLSRTKALLVLDDVETPAQLKRLVGDLDRFGPGSKIIVTSRHKLVVDAEYKVEGLDFDDACKLFYLNAFGEKCCRRGYKEISDRVVEYTKCHPLALEVLGASVFCFLESIEDWEKELEKLKRIPNDEIQVVLKRSYNACDVEEKGLFLDIACFFKGKPRDFVEGILEGKPITGLVNKSLVTIEDGKICMHDLIQEMGRDIVCQSTDNLGERSRLWIAKDVSFVLKNNRGTEAIEGIYLPLIEEEMHLRPNVFEEVCKLRLLKIYFAPGVCFLPYSKVKVYIDGDLKYLPNGLRYLHWEQYPGRSLPSNFKPQNLVELHMPNSNLEQLWDGVQELGSLKCINLRFSLHLTKIPDLSQAPKLESINLRDCTSLIHIHSLNLQANLDQSANWYKWLKSHDYEFLPTPGSIILNGCERLWGLPEVSGNILGLDLRSTAFEELPSSIESLENLLHLDLRECHYLKSLPKLPRSIEVLLLDNSGMEHIPSSLLECLCSLRILSLRNCYIESLPSNINLKALEKLCLEGTAIQELPSTIENSIGLQWLNLSSCKHLEFIPKTLCKLTRLQNLWLWDCSKLESFPMLLGVCSLTGLCLSYCKIREIPDWLGSLTSLTELFLRGNIFDGIPESIGMLYNLTDLDISECKNLQSLPTSIGMLYNLKKLDISECKNLQSLPTSIGMLYNLKDLDISECKNLQSLPELPLFIESFNAEDCSSLEMVSSLRSTLTLGRWLDNYDISIGRHTREFSFLNCRKLGEDAINNIFREFLYKVFCTATTPPEVDSARVIDELIVYYPTEEIPRWFNNQSEGSSVTITLPPNWYNPKTFLGFVVSVVVQDNEDSDFSGYFFNVTCKLRLMTNNDRFRDDVYDSNTFVRRCFDHIVMWYISKEYIDRFEADFEKYQEASFEFENRDLEAKRCGVRMLYLNDAVEESDDGSIANFESWRIEVMNLDTSDDDFHSYGSDDDYQSCESDVIGSDTDYVTTDDDYQSFGSDDDDQSCGS